ncbi:concanavalin A-like lectin/glucanase [Ascobolus immersus RN42]|uniref:Concanavalin A-like lectin/glucanase n=1 Tax=Ascobolus immersus RN42 TaxID=1160509 RepID=A0A3N4HV94_ASCIM|nr:concanavalin A-like lectin/glucanase [Ascobolus immersus RN42]
MKYQFFIPAAVFAALTNAQTWSACNPMEKEGCPDNKALGCTYEYSYKDSLSAAPDFSFGGSGSIKYEDGAAHFRIEKSLEAPTIASNFYIMYGKVDVKMKASPGAGIVSSVVLQSDTLDEIDWEWLGGRTYDGQSNYFGKGNTTTYDRGAYHELNHQEFHTYGVEWTENSLTWLLDGVPLRTLNKADVKYDLYPQTPMQIKIGSWAGGDVENNAPGVVQWAEGPTDFSKAPFDMIIESIKITDYSNGKYYKYTDKTGSAKSIKAEGGQINAGPQNNKCGVVPTELPALPTSTKAKEAVTSTEAAKPKETATETESVEVPEATEEPEADAPFPTMTVPFPFGNGTHEGGSAQPTGGVQTPIEDDEDSETEKPVEGGDEVAVTTTADAEFPESTTTTTTLTRVQTVTTCLAVTTTDAAGHEVITSSTATLTRTEKITQVVTVPCETTTMTAPGGAVITTVVPGTIPASNIATPTSAPVTKPTEVPVTPGAPGAEKPVVPAPGAPGAEKPVVPAPSTPGAPVNPEAPNKGVETPAGEAPAVPEVPSVETPVEGSKPVVEVPEVPAGETPVEGETPSVETPVEGETPSVETPSMARLLPLRPQRPQLVRLQPVRTQPRATPQSSSSQPRSRPTPPSPSPPALPSALVAQPVPEPHRSQPSTTPPSQSSTDPLPSHHQSPRRFQSPQVLQVPQRPQTLQPLRAQSQSSLTVPLRA